MLKLEVKAPASMWRPFGLLDFVLCAYVPYVSRITQSPLEVSIYRRNEQNENRQGRQNVLSRVGRNDSQDE